MMLTFLLGGAALVAMVPALAQAPVAPPAPVTPYVAPVPPAPPAPMMREHTRDEMVAKVREHFSRLDTNRDGVLTQAEADAGREAFKVHRMERRADRRERRAHRMEKRAHRDPGAAFDRFDANKNGSISREEFANHHETRVEKRIAMKAGEPGEPGAHAGKARRIHRMGGMIGGHMFEMADADKDGRVSLQEASDAAARHFDMADANRDGRITPDERRQMHRQMIEKHRAPKAG